MKPSSYAPVPAIAFLFGSLALIGCGGALPFPDAVVSPQVNGPAIQGRALGGHSPIVGAHVYLVQPGLKGYGSEATSILGNNGATSAAGYKIYTNGAPLTPGGPATALDYNVPAGAQYVVTDSNGDFNLSGAYACIADQPVYIYSYGGSSLGNTNPDYTVPVPGYAKTAVEETYTGDVSQIQVGTPVTGKDTTAKAPYTFTLSVAAPGDVDATYKQSIVISGLTNAADGESGFAQDNATYSAEGLIASNGTTFSSAALDEYAEHQGVLGDVYSDNGAGTYGPADIGPGTFSATIKYYPVTYTYNATSNPSVELAVLGNCPDTDTNTTPNTGNFSGASTAINFIYMNEVSTVAAAYVFQPFTLAANNNAWDIGSSGTTQAQVGIANAANTAGQLYDIQGRGGISSATGEGEGHIANSTTPATLGGPPNAGNGTVPQSTIDTLANVLAACIDQGVGTSNSIPAECTTLFNTATDNGSTVDSGDTAAADIATAAINIARYPAGNRSGTPDPTYTSDIYNVQSGVVPYAPQLGAYPNDWTLGISYTGGGVGATGGQSPIDVSVDNSGNIFTVNYASNLLSIFNPLGEPLSANGFSGNGMDGPESVAIDSTSTHVWLANYKTGYVSEFTTAGAAVANYPVGEQAPQNAAIDGSGNIWVTTNTPSALVKMSSTGTVLTTITSGGVASPFGLAIEPGATGDVWVADETGDEASLYTNAGVAATGSPFTVGGAGGDAGGDGAANIEGPTGIAIDSAGNAWFTDGSGAVSELTSAGAPVGKSPFATGAAANVYSDGIAIDGGGNVWVTSSTGETVYELNNAGAAITPTTGYTAKPATEADGIAIDPSGNVWYDSYNAAVLYELVGAAVPVVTPISYAEEKSELGTAP